MRATRHIGSSRQRVAQEILSLPVFPDLSQAEINAVIEGVQSFFARDHHSIRQPRLSLVVPFYNEAGNIESLYRELCLQNPRRFVLSPGARDFLDTLAQNHIPRTIATSSEITNLKFFIQHLSLDRWFDVAKIVYDDGARPGKPAPDMYLAAAQNIQVAPSESETAWLSTPCPSFRGSRTIWRFISLSSTYRMVLLIARPLEELRTGS